MKLKNFNFDKKDSSKKRDDCHFGFELLPFLSPHIIFYISNLQSHHHHHYYFVYFYLQALFNRVPSKIGPNCDGAIAVLRLIWRGHYRTHSLDTIPATEMINQPKIILSGNIHKLDFWWQEVSNSFNS